MNLRITEKDYKSIQQIVAPSFRRAVQFAPETGCLLLVSANRNKENPSLIVNEILEPGAGDIAESASDGLVFSASYLRRALLAVRERQLAGFLTLHTHPLADDRVQFSSYDDEQDPRLMDNLYDLQPEGVFGSVVLGRNSVAGRIWDSGIGGPVGLDRLFVIGEDIQIFSLNGDVSPDPTPAEIFDRALAITGVGALSQLALMKVGVVGAGGTGSLMVELLARAGVGEIVLFDFDAGEESNLNRVLHLRESDVAAQRSKSERLAEAIREAGLPTSVTVITSGDIRNATVAAELLRCDLFIGCVDRDWPRFILCQAAYRYLVPYIDIGTEIGVGYGRIQSVDSRVSLVGPGRPCLLCAGLVSTDRIRVEGYDEEERDRVLNMGYTTDIRIKAPAVMDVNMRAASMAMLVVRHLLQPFLATPLPHSIRETVTNFSIRGVSHNGDPNCSICGATKTR